MNDRGTKHKENFTVVCAYLFHLASDLLDSQHLHFFAGDIALHKGECFASAIAFEGLNANTIVSNYYLIANLHLMHRAAEGAIILFIDSDRNVHLNIFDLNPVTIQ